MNELNKAQSRPAAAPGAVSSSPSQVGIPNPPGSDTAVIPSKELGLNSMEAPDVPITQAQEAQLQDLLVKYKVNEVTPEEYHKRRAEILAQHKP